LAIFRRGKNCSQFLILVNILELRFLYVAGLVKFVR
jgi:hypothetical protein